MASFAPPPPNPTVARKQALATKGGLTQPPTMGGPPMRGGLTRPPMRGAVNPYRSQRAAVTPELLAQMARRRLGG